VVFPGSNCDRDAGHGIDDVLGTGTAEFVWHGESDLRGADAVVLPGGFSYGDYLRCGALARVSPIMSAVRQAAHAGVPVLGICNGFQVLCEAGLLPGALLRNDHGQFRCDVVPLRVCTTRTPWTSGLQLGQSVRLPIAHGEGRYHADPHTLQRLLAEDRIVLVYEGENPNGSVAHIAGICSEDRNVVGMMPHPERAVHAWLGGTDGRAVLASILRSTLADDRRSAPVILEEAAHVPAHV